MEENNYLLEASKFSRQVLYLITHPGIVRDPETGKLYRPVVTGHEGPIPEEITLEPLYDLDNIEPVIVRNIETLSRYELIETGHI